MAKGYDSRTQDRNAGPCTRELRAVLLVLLVLWGLLVRPTVPQARRLAGSQARRLVGS